MAECDYLEDGVTTLMMRGLPPRDTAENLVCRLNSFMPGKFDFVYVPRARRRNSSIGLAFVNCVDHASAKLAFEFFWKEGQERSSSWTTPRVSQAFTQGLGPNLAFFVASSGPEQFENPNAPQVFQHGVRVPRLADAISQFVSPDLLEKAREDFRKMKESPEMRHAGRNSRRSPRTDSDVNMGHPSPVTTPVSKLVAKVSRPSASTAPSGVSADTTFGSSSTSSGYISTGGETAGWDPASSGSRSRHTRGMAGLHGAGMGSGRAAKALREMDDRLRQDIVRLGLRIRTSNLPDDIVAIVSL
eukprot:gb/GFBE01076408.1/.p1 GENE.gb/GFBE01076408.1/~~gb/GFBE01076408.1/.p1  ORF type:complete len:301 (+),score=30.86 gb/GFBE01076408.1/:1-903(+)